MVEKQLLHSKIYGEDKAATPLLVLHGLFGMLDNWGTFGKEMGDSRPVHLLDLRNHGKSFHSDEMSHETMSTDILNYLDHHGIQKAILLGHSLGGKAVMQFALTHADRVEKLIVADIAPKAYPPHHQGILKALQSLDFEQISSRQEAEETLGSYIKEKSVVYFLLKNLYWKDAHNKKLAWRFNLDVLAEKYAEFVSKAVRHGVFSGPTLFLAGEKSNYILPQDALQIRQQFPDSKIIKISNAGHWLHADNPEDFTREIRNFIG